MLTSRRAVLFVAKVLCHLSFQGTFYKAPGEFADETIFAEEVFAFALLEQLVNQFFA